MTTLANTVGVGRLVKPLKLLAIFRVELSIYQRVMGKSSKKKKKTSTVHHVCRILGLSPLP